MNNDNEKEFKNEKKSSIATSREAPAVITDSKSEDGMFVF